MFTRLRRFNARLAVRALLATTLLTGVQGLTTTARAQCADPTLFRIGGDVTAATPVQPGILALARDNRVDVVSLLPALGQPLATVYVAGSLASVRISTMTSDGSPRLWAYSRPIDSSVGTITAVSTANPAAPVVEGIITNVSNVRAMAVAGNRLYVLSSPRNLAIYNITTPSAPTLLSLTPLPDTFAAAALSVTGPFVAIAITGTSLRPASLLIMNAANPAAPVETARVGGNRVGRSVIATPNSNVYVVTVDTSDGTPLIERWNLSPNASAPSLAAVSSILSGALAFGEFVALPRTFPASNPTTLGLFQGTSAFSLFNPTTLAATPTGDLPDTYNTMSPDGTTLYYTLLDGRLATLSLATLPSTTYNATYADLGPGSASSVLTQGTGYSVLTHQTSHWIARVSPPSPNLIPPTRLARIFPASDAKFGKATLLSDLLLTVERQFVPSAFRIVVYRVTVAPTPGVARLGTIELDPTSDVVDLNAATMLAGRRLAVLIDPAGPGAKTLNYYKIDNAAAPTLQHSTVLDSRLGRAVRLFPGSTLFNTPDRLLVGSDSAGPTSTTTPPAVANYSLNVPAFPIFESISAFRANRIFSAPGNTAMLLDFDRLSKISLDNLVNPLLLSQTVLPTNLGDLQSLASTDLFGTSAVGLYGGLSLLRFTNYNTPAPAINQFARFPNNFATVNDLATDAGSIHVASTDGYAIYPLAFDAPPAEDPSNNLPFNSYRDTCTGLTITMTGRFVAIPAVSSIRWERNDVPLNDGPTGTGSVISGATTNTLTITNVSAADTGQYRPRATNTCGSVTTFNRVTVQPGGYANCDGSTIPPVLGAADLSCFLSKYRAGDAYANCDGSTVAPILGAADFSCFLAKYRTGCP